MTDSASEEGTPILIEFSDSKARVQPCYIPDFIPGEYEAKSEENLQKAWKTIEEMAHQVHNLQDKIPVEFSQVDVQFGINFMWEAGVLLAKAGSEASINVTLTWTRPQKEVATK